MQVEIAIPHPPPTLAAQPIIPSFFFFFFFFFPPLLHRGVRWFFLHRPPRIGQLCQYTISNRANACPGPLPGRKSAKIEFYINKKIKILYKISGSAIGIDQRHPVVISQALFWLPRPQAFCWFFLSFSSESNPPPHQCHVRPGPVSWSAAVEIGGYILVRNYLCGTSPLQSADCNLFFFSNT